MYTDSTGRMEKKPNDELNWTPFRCFNIERKLETKALLMLASSSVVT